MTFLLLAHAAATLVLVGLIWTVQVVHYPLFRFASDEGFDALHAAHARRVTWLVAALMPAEAILALFVAISSPSAWAWAGLMLVGVVWLSTAFLQVPHHNRLAKGFDADAHRALVSSNWVRTAAWTARGVIALVLLT